jgi:hypothetical protein
MSKFLFLAIAVAGLYFLFKGDRRKKEMSSKKEADRLKATGELVRDPECGTFVRKDGDIRVRSGDAVHVFCSYQCREKYLKRLGVEPPKPDTDEEETREG